MNEEKIDNSYDCGDETSHQYLQEEAGERYFWDMMFGDYFEEKERKQK